jgi:hypothetical protein
MKLFPRRNPLRILFRSTVDPQLMYIGYLFKRQLEWIEFNLREFRLGDHETEPFDTLPGYD